MSLIPSEGCESTCDDNCLPNEIILRKTLNARTLLSVCVWSMSPLTWQAWLEVLKEFCQEGPSDSNFHLGGCSLNEIGQFLAKHILCLGCAFLRSEK